MRYWTQLASEQFPPSDLVRQAVEAEELGATVVCLQNASGADPHAALRVYGEQVLPTLTGARV